ncbi:MAG: acyltransferase, partial [Rikenellaceae bacterium]
KPLSPLWIPVNTLGRQSLKSAQMFDEALEGELPILTFPAGLCSRVFNGEICDPEWKNTTVKRAHTSSRHVVPIFVDGTLHKGFYRLYKLRKALGIKANIEMLLLVDGMFRQKGRTIKVRFGKPISPEELSAIGSISEQTLAVREAAYALRD